MAASTRDLGRPGCSPALSGSDPPRARITRRGLPGTRVREPALRPEPHLSRLLCSRFPSRSRCFPGKRSLPLRSPPPGCRKEVTGTFPLLLFARPCGDGRAEQLRSLGQQTIPFPKWTKPELFPGLPETKPRLDTLPPSPPRPIPNSKLSKA